MAKNPMQTCCSSLAEIRRSLFSHTHLPFFHQSRTLDFWLGTWSSIVEDRHSPASHLGEAMCPNSGQ